VHANVVFILLPNAFSHAPAPWKPAHIPVRLSFTQLPGLA
jgi:hypothetical protein